MVCCQSGRRDRGINCYLWVVIPCFYCGSLNKCVLYVNLRGHCLSDLTGISLSLWCNVAGESRTVRVTRYWRCILSSMLVIEFHQGLLAHTGGSMDVICELWTVYWYSNFLLLSKFMFLRAIWEQVLVKFFSWQLSCTIWSKNRSQIIRFTCQHFWIITSSCMASSVIRA